MNEAEDTREEKKWKFSKAKSGIVALNEKVENNKSKGKVQMEG